MIPDPSFARALRAALAEAAAYAPAEALASLEDACRDCEDALLYWHERAETAPLDAVLFAHLVGTLLRRCAANRRMDDDDSLTQTYRKLIENRPAWMPA